MEKNEETSIEVKEDDTKIEQVIEKKDIISVEDLFEKDITYRDLPDAVKEYFQQFLDKLPKTVVAHKSYIEIVQRMKSILMTGYLRDIIFDHIIKVKEKYKDNANPEEWARQVNPTLFTKFKQMRDSLSDEMLELFDTEGLDEDFDRFEKVSITRIMKERKLEKDKKVDDKIVDADYEVIENADNTSGK